VLRCCCSGVVVVDVAVVVERKIYERFAGGMVGLVMWDTLSTTAGHLVDFSQSCHLWRVVTQAACCSRHVVTCLPFLVLFFYFLVDHFVSFSLHFLLYFPNPLVFSCENVHVGRDVMKAPG
jgi:hypothetical protein